MRGGFSLIFFRMLTEKVKSTIVQTVAEVNPAAFVVDLTLKRSTLSTLFVRVDTDKGISLSECSKLSRAIGKRLEDMKEMDFSYRLEVSSPGVGFPLQLHRQYVQNIGRCLRVQFNDGEMREGELISVEKSHFTLGPLPSSTKQKKKKKATASPKEADVAPAQIAFSEIKESKVIII